MPWGVPKIGAFATPVASGNLTLAEPAGTAEGDLQIACIAIRSTVGFTNADWTLIESQLTGDTDATNGIASGQMWYRIRGAAAGTLTWSRTGGNLGAGRILGYTGATASPLDSHSSNTLASASATATTGTITTAEANELIVAMTSAGDNLTASAFDAATDPATASGATDTTTAPTAGTWLERADDGTQTGADGALAIADAIRATAGATGTMQATISGTGARHVMIASAFKMAPATGDASVSLPVVTLSATASAIVAGTGSLSVPMLTLSASGEVSDPSITGSAAITMPMLTVSAAAASFVVGLAALTLPPLSVSATAASVVVGIAALTLPMLGLTATGSVLIVGLSALALPVVTLAATATAIVTGLGALVLPMLIVVGAATGGGDAPGNEPHLFGDRRRRAIAALFTLLLLVA